VPHIVLLGDSIFDYVAYVRGGLPVVDQLRAALPRQVTLLAVDGSVTGDLGQQLDQVPAEATQLVLSVGGYDAYNASGILRQGVVSVADALHLLAAVQAQFRVDYEGALHTIAALGKPMAVCTIYDSIPGLGQVERAALALFNDVILRSAFKSGLPVIDLRLASSEAEDFSEVSPIEPSVAGGAKIARVIARVATNHDFTRALSTVYA
jgi:GDSL-like Lipase/Acylhydrolase family